MELPSPPYLVLQSQSKKKNSKSYYVMDFGSKLIMKIGRGHDSDIRNGDISVSRYHAWIEYDEKDGKFYLFDNNSKFGSVMLAPSVMEFHKGMTMEF